MDNKLKAFILILQIVNCLTYQVKVNIAFNNQHGLDASKQNSVNFEPDLKGIKYLTAKQIDHKPAVKEIQKKFPKQVDDKPDVEKIQNLLAQELDDSINNLQHCGVGQILKCTARVTKAIEQCMAHPDIVQCVTEILGETDKCTDCIKKICHILHIKGC